MPENASDRILMVPLRRRKKGATIGQPLLIGRDQRPPEISDEDILMIDVKEALGYLKGAFSPREIIQWIESHREESRRVPVAFIEVEVAS
jgi:hypothetical protein